MALPQVEVCDIYSTLKGTGRNAGTPFVCVRLFGTNFQDRLDTHRYAWDTTESKKRKKMLTISEIVDRIAALRSDKHRWLVTGGEPMLQQAYILDIADKFKEQFGYEPSIEIETNGLIMPLEQIYRRIANFNVELKLSNSIGSPTASMGTRISESVLRFYVASKKADFIFSISSESDLKEVISLQQVFKIPDENIWLKSVNPMIPLFIWETCLKRDFKLSSNLVEPTGL